MKKTLLFLSLASIFLLGAPEVSFAKKKYRYIKREHGVQFNFQAPVTVPSFGLDLSLEGAYTYNWKGFLELGPYFALDTGIYPFRLNSYGGGLLVEWNIIKNRGKRKYIPTVGISGGVQNNGGLDIVGGAHLALKLFVAKRTPFIAKVAYQAAIPSNFNFRSLNHTVDISGGFAYYFDFY